MKIRPRYRLLLIFLLTVLFAELAAWWGIKANERREARLAPLYSDLGHVYGGIRRGFDMDAQIDSLKRKFSDEYGRDMGAEIDQKIQRVKSEPYAKNQLIKNSHN
jgi:hypothetical protein